MRFRCVIGILFFLTLKESQGKTQAKCSTRLDWWSWNGHDQALKTCFPNIDEVNDEDFTISSDKDSSFFGLIHKSVRDSRGLHLVSKKSLKFLPTNVSSVFPDLVAYAVWNFSITMINRHPFRNLSKLEYLKLSDNKIEHIASDAFVDLVRLVQLNFNINRIQTLSADTFIPLKDLKELYFDYNQIHQLDHEIFKSLVKIKCIFLRNNLIAALDEKIFESLLDLREIDLSYNKLQGVPGNLFRKNLKLTTVWLRENEIKFIDANMFDHLPDLDSVDLEGNRCVKKWYGKYLFLQTSLNKMTSDLKQTCTPACGGPRHALGLIDRGENFPHGALPWIVALMLTKFRPPHFFCAGTLISETFVVSAAHCILDKGSASELLPRDVLAIFGAHDLGNPYEAGKIMESPIKIFIHEDWNHLGPGYDADISLLRFQKGNIHFSDFIRPICLWFSENDPSVTTGVVTNWGQSKDTTKLHENLPKMITAPILTNEDCWIEDRGLVNISSKRTFCAGLRKGSGVCTGDSGGGLFIKVDGFYFLKGIVLSSMINNQGCDVSRNAIYTNVLKFRDWIAKKTQ